MNRAITIVVTMIAAGFAGWLLPIRNLIAATQPLIVFLSIMAAAILVRLNRGIPSLDWRAIKPSERSSLSQQLYELAIEYAWLLVTQAATLFGLLSLSAAGPVSCWPRQMVPYSQICVGILGGLFALCILRMAYVVWRDVDLVRLQKTILDRLADEDEQAAERRIAADKVEAIKAAQIQR